MKLMIRKDDNEVGLQLRLKREHNSTSFGDRKVKAGITGLRKCPSNLFFQTDTVSECLGYTLQQRLRDLSLQ